MFNLFSRHHLLPGEFYQVSYGEQIMLMAFSALEIELEQDMIKQLNKEG